MAALTHRATLIRSAPRVGDLVAVDSHRSVTDRWPVFRTPEENRILDSSGTRALDREPLSAQRLVLLRHILLTLAFAEMLFPQAEANDLEVEYMELVRSGFSKSPASLERMREVARRRQVLHQKGRGRKKKKRKKRKLPKSSSPRSLPTRAVRTRKSGHLSCGSSWCSVSGCCLTSPGLWDYWETTFSRSAWSDSGYTHMRQSTRHLGRPLVSGSRLFDAVCA